MCNTYGDTKIVQLIDKFCTALICNCGILTQCEPIWRPAIVYMATILKVRSFEYAEWCVDRVWRRIELAEVLSILKLELPA
jgi:hypothetical protein